MLFAVLTEAKVRPHVGNEEYLALVQKGHLYVSRLMDQGKIRQAFVRAGNPTGFLIVESDSAEELEDIVQGNPTATYARYQTIPLADPEILYDPNRREDWDEGERVLEFDDSLLIRASRERVYDYLWRVDRWPSILSHVKDIRVLEESDTYQEFEMEVHGAAGTEKSRSKRYGKRGESVRYEQVTPPPIFRSHRGIWTLEERDGAVEVTSRHSIGINGSMISQALGRPYADQEARTLVRHFVGNNSLA
ncbi:MAG: muconolactone Delta-isomerase family protein, partial [Spirochaetales bacterium]|nr:muconolactone Delta-isomerase family protein [Spirochaetales bacterium]